MSNPPPKSPHQEKPAHASATNPAHAGSEAQQGANAPQQPGARPPQGEKVKSNARGDKAEGKVSPMAKVPNLAEEGGVFDEEKFFRIYPHLRRRRELLRAWRETLPPGERPKPFRFLPWLGLGDREEDYPPPERCTPEDGRLLYGGYYDLWKLGVPLDFQYPVDFSPSPSFYDTDEDRRLAESFANSKSKAPSREERAAEYEQKVKKPLLRKARKLLTELESTMEKLIGVEGQHPRYRSPYSPEPFMESPELREIKGLKSLAWYGRSRLDRIGHVKKGRRGDTVRNELLNRLQSQGLGKRQIEAVFVKLGLAEAGNEGERIRQRLRRQK